MKLLALVPARGGSKRVPNKNILELGGKPLIEWTIDQALGLPEIEDVLVSTDSMAIAKVAENAGALVPWLRPAELSTDTSTTVAVVLHALTWYEQINGPIDAILLLQPTSPFRTVDSISNAIRTYASQNAKNRHSVISVSPAIQHPAWSFYMKNGEVNPVLGWSSVSQRSQDLTPVYVLNGAIYVIPAKDIRQGLPIVRQGFLPFEMNDQGESLDIDTHEDWNYAEFLIKNKCSSKI
jgi:CMP-N,N'-diacetyllegionaminic acid synthase